PRTQGVGVRSPDGRWEDRLLDLGDERVRRAAHDGYATLAEPTCRQQGQMCVYPPDGDGRRAGDTEFLSRLGAHRAGDVADRENRRGQFLGEVGYAELRIEIGRQP